MKKKIILISLLFYYQNTASQTDLILDFKKKKKYTSIKLSENKSKDYIIINNDTLFNRDHNLKIDNLEKFCDCFNNKEFNIQYSSAVQFHLPKNKQVVETKQWNSQIIVFVDKSIDKTVKKKFVAFFKQINDIENFKISFTKSKKESNYLIKVSDSTISNFKSDTKEYNELSPYSKVTYNLTTDKNNKFYGGTLLIDKTILKDKDLTLKKLKQMFYMSLGPFANRESMPIESLLNPNYVESEIITDFDLKVLKTHYYKIYPRPFSKLDLIIMKRKSKSICKNE